MNIKQAKKAFSDYIRNKGLRHTAQRDTIVDCFLTAERHITADDLYDKLKKTSSEIGIATVHRNLKLMCESGIAEEIKIGNEKTRYEQKVGQAHHDHLICTKCGEFTEVYDKRIERLQDELAKANRFIPQKHKLEIYGLCGKCR